MRPKQNKEENSLYINGLKRIAYDRINHNTEAKLIKWWSNKYKLPPTDERLLKYTWEELFLEYYEDLIIDDPKVASSLMTDEEVAEIKQEDSQVPDINPVFVKRSKKVDLEQFKSKEISDVSNKPEHS